MACASSPQHTSNLPLYSHAEEWSPLWIGLGVAFCLSGGLDAASIFIIAGSARRLHGWHWTLHLYDGKLWTLQTSWRSVVAVSYQVHRLSRARNDRSTPNVDLRSHELSVGRRLCCSLTLYTVQTLLTLLALLRSLDETFIAAIPWQCNGFRALCPRGGPARRRSLPPGTRKITSRLSKAQGNAVAMLLTLVIGASACQDTLAGVQQTR